jgi:hypothetical protein
VIDALIEDGGPLRSLSPAANRLGLMYWDHRWHRVRVTSSATSQAHIDRAVEVQHLNLRAWAGRGASFGELSDDEHWMTVTFPAPGTAEIHLSEPEGRAELLAQLLAWVVDHDRVVVGGAWGGDPPPWVDAPNRWWFRRFDAPIVPGPLWLLVAPPAAHRVLSGDAEARSLAVDVTSLRHGALWRLVAAPADLTGEVVGRWSSIMDRLGLLPTDPPVSDLVDGYLAGSHPAVPHRWP